MQGAASEIEQGSQAKISSLAIAESANNPKTKEVNKVITTDLSFISFYIQLGIWD
jgi:hypothetical protein